MSEAEAKEVVRRYVRAWETGDLELMESVLAPGFRHTVVGQDEERAALLERVRSFHQLYEVIAYEIDELIAEGDRVACGWTMTARQRAAQPLGAIGELVGTDTLDPSGREIKHTGLFTAVVRDGRLVTGWGEWDRLGFLLRAGLAPSSDA